MQSPPGFGGSGLSFGDFDGVDAAAAVGGLTVSSPRTVPTSPQHAGENMSRPHDGVNASIWQICHMCLKIQKVEIRDIRLVGVWSPEI